MTEEEFANYFSQFGHVLDATLMLDRNTGRPRGFGFITFESDRGVEAALSRRDLILHHKTVFFFSSFFADATLSGYMTSY